MGDTVSDRVSPSAEGIARIVLRPIGSPLPLGFVALGFASVALSGLQLSWVPVSEGSQVAWVLLVLVAPLQLLSAVFGYLARDSVGGTGLGLLAGIWLLTGMILLTAPPGSTSRALGLVLLFAAAGLIVPTTAAAFGKALAAIIMFGAAVRFALTGVYEFAGGAVWEQISAWWGIGLCVVALYGAFAFEIEDTSRRLVLPVGRHGAGRAALAGTLADDLDRVRHEAGVREQL